MDPKRLESWQIPLSHIGGEHGVQVVSAHHGLARELLHHPGLHACHRIGQGQDRSGVSGVLTRESHELPARRWGPKALPRPLEPEPEP
jgi:hypothetical protein